MAREQEGPNKVACGVVAILIGALGVHKFMMGQTTAGLIMLLVTVLTCGIAGSVMGIIGLVEGIIYGSSEKICNTTTEIQTSKEARIAGHFREFGFG